MSANSHPLSAKSATLLMAVGIILFALIYQIAEYWFIGLESSADVVDCDDLIKNGFLESSLDLPLKIPISRFAPHQYGETELDDDVLHHTPQVFRTLALTLSDNGGMLTQHCEAIYTNVSAQEGAAVEMPAHCLRSLQSGDKSISTFNGVRADGNSTATKSKAKIYPPLNNVCVYMGSNVREPVKVFRVVSAKCKSPLDRPDNSTLLNDSCIVGLDQAIPASIADQPLRWWQADNNEKPVWTQLNNDLGIEDGEFSCNVKSGNIESNIDLSMVSHSIDNDGLGLRRVISKGKAIYQHSNEGVIMHSGLIPNDIDTRSGDSGAAVLAQIRGKKTLIGMQVAVMSGYTQQLPAEQQAENVNYLKNYNMAIHPHIGISAETAYPYLYSAK